MSGERARRIGPYRIEEALGSGAMGDVFRARHEAMDVVHAVKLLKADLGADREAGQRFVREFQALAKVSTHPNVVTVHAAGQERGRLYFSMELVEGEDLQQKLRHGPMKPDQAVGFVLQAARAVEAMHAAGLVHRDIKPANIIVEPSGVAKLGDFGLAKVFLDDKNRLTQTGEMLGTPLFMAPEQIVGEDVGPATDVYALGMTLYTLLAGQSAVYSSSAVQVMSNILDHKHHSLLAVAPSTPPILADLCQRTFADFGERPTVSELIEGLEAYLAGEERGPARARGGWGVVALAVAGLVVAVLGGVIWTVTRPDVSATPSPSPSPTPSPRVSPKPSPAPSAHAEARTLIARAGEELEAPGVAARTFALAWAAVGEADTPQARELRTEAELGARRAVARATFGKPLHTIEREGGHVRSLAFANAGDEEVFLMVGRYDGRVQWFDLEDYSLHKELTDLGDKLRCAQRSIGGTSRLVAATTQEKVNLINVDTKRVWQTLLAAGGDDVRWSAFSPDNFGIATCTQSGRVHMWGWFTGELFWHREHGGKANYCVFSPDGVTVYTVGTRGAARAWDSKTGSPRWTADVGGPVYQCAISPSGQTLATAGQRGVRYLEASTGEDRGQSHVGVTLESVAYDSRGEVLAAGSGEGIVYLWKAETREKWKQDIDTGTQGSVNNLLFSEDGRTLYVGCESGVVQVYALWHPAWKNPPPVPGFAEGPVEAVERALSR